MAERHISMQAHIETIKILSSKESKSQFITSLCALSVAAIGIVVGHLNGKAINMNAQQIHNSTYQHQRMDETLKGFISVSSAVNKFFSHAKSIAIEHEVVTKEIKENDTEYQAFVDAVFEINKEFSVIKANLLYLGHKDTYAISQKYAANLNNLGYTVDDSDYTVAMIQPFKKTLLSLEKQFYLSLGDNVFENND